MARPRHSQPIRATSTGYGTAVRDTQLQQAQPLPAPPAPGEMGPIGPPPVSPGAEQGQMPVEGPPPTPFVPPSSNPDVWGPSTQAMQQPLLPPNSEYGIVTALFQRFPNEDLRRLLERAAYYASQSQPK